MSNQTSNGPGCVGALMFFGVLYLGINALFSSLPVTSKDGKELCWPSRLILPPFATIRTTPLLCVPATAKTWEEVH